MRIAWILLVLVLSSCRGTTSSVADIDNQDSAVPAGRYYLNGSSNSQAGAAIFFDLPAAGSVKLQFIPQGAASDISPMPVEVFASGNAQLKLIGNKLGWRVDSNGPIEMHGFHGEIFNENGNKGFHLCNAKYTKVCKITTQLETQSIEVSDIQYELALKFDDVTFACRFKSKSTDQTNVLDGFSTYPEVFELRDNTDFSILDVVMFLKVVDGKKQDDLRAGGGNRCPTVLRKISDALLTDGKPNGRHVILLKKKYDSDSFDAKKTQRFPK